MDPRTRPVGQRIWRQLSSVRTGIFLLILVGLAAAAGTLVLQRPLTDSEQMARTYRPETLRWLDALGLTDVFHSWWFAALLTLVCVNLVLASLQRFPTVWKYFTRPYHRPDAHFVAGLPLQAEIAIHDAESGIEAATRAFRRMGLKPQRLGKNGDASLYAERHRIARLAAYVVHASLLLVIGGATVDGIWGYRGFVAMTKGEGVNQIELRNGAVMPLEFTLRCEGAGQENYADGTPRRWWSQLVVLEGGREVQRKEIEVNEPLVHRGLRFYQSSYGSSGEVGQVHLLAKPVTGPAAPQAIALRPNQPVHLDADTSVELAAFVPDFILRGNAVETRSNEPNNPAILLRVSSKPSGEVKVWLFPRFPGFTHPNHAPYSFEVRDLEMGYFTGLQVAYEPGQWAVWAGVILMGIGLLMAFYLVHARYWAVTVDDGLGRRMLWVGASPSKNRAEFEHRFRKLVEAIEGELDSRAAVPATGAAVPARG